jgi:hypothetical protein
MGVIGRHGMMCDIIMRSDPAQLETLEVAGGPIILDKIAFFQNGSSRMDDVCALLDEEGVIFEVVDADAIEDR